MLTFSPTETISLTVVLSCVTPQLLISHMAVVGLRRAQTSWTFLHTLGQDQKPTAGSDSATDRYPKQVDKGG